MSLPQWVAYGKKILDTIGYNRRGLRNPMYLSVECKHNDLVDLSNAQAVWDVRGTRILRYTVDVTNSRLSQHRTLSAADTGSLKLKLQA
jgi:hypothetical protein